MLLVNHTINALSTSHIILNRLLTHCIYSNIVDLNMNHQGQRGILTLGLSIGRMRRHYHIMKAKW
jgi:hypothetical protein